MKDSQDIPSHIRARVLRSNSLTIWPIDENPVSDSFQIARFFQDQGWNLYPVHDTVDRILEVPVFRDIRLIPDDYDILLLFVLPNTLPEAVNAIFNADYVPPLVWAHKGIIDLASRDRLTEEGILTVMNRDLRECYVLWADQMPTPQAQDPAC